MTDTATASVPTTEAAPFGNAPLDIDSAAALLTNMDKQPRDPAGRFYAEKQVEKAADAVSDDNKVVDLKTKEPVPAKAEAAPEDEDDWLEWAAEKDGEAPRREKLSAVIEAWENIPAIQKELAELKERSAQVPAEYHEGLQQIAQQRSAYVEALKKLSGVLAGAQPPSLEMLNPQSQHYNPEAYYVERQRFEDDQRRSAAARAEIEAREKEQREYQDWDMKQRLAREMQTISKEWPEFVKDEATKAAAKSALKEYGFSDQEISAIGDARYMRVVKDAMEFRKMKAEQAKTVQQVRAKPKLVRGQARTNTKDTARVSALSRLQQTGSVDDAVAALRGFF